MAPLPLTPLAVGEFRQLPPALHERLFPHLPRAAVARMGTHGDGTCLFHSLAAAINYNGYLSQPPAKRQAIGQAFRCAFQRHMDRGKWAALQRSHPHNMHKSFDEVRQDFCRPAEWATEPMIKYVSEVMQLNIIFLSGNTGTFHCSMAGLPTQQDTIVIVWVDNSHFEPLLFARARSPHRRSVTVRGRLSPRNRNDAVTLAHLAHDFTRVCAASLPRRTRQDFQQQMAAHAVDHR